jgi:hypothetical protein
MFAYFLTRHFIIFQHRCVAHFYYIPLLSISPIRQKVYYHVTKKANSYEI